jgi:hypothetical protein
LSFNSKLSHFDKNVNLNLNLNHKWLSPTWRRERILPNARIFVNVVQHLRDEEGILHEIENQPGTSTSTRRLEIHLGGFQFASSKHCSGNSSKQRRFNYKFSNSQKTIKIKHNLE